jgi:hypothetical protein
MLESDGALVWAAMAEIADEAALIPRLRKGAAQSLNELSADAQARGFAVEAEVAQAIPLRRLTGTGVGVELLVVATQREILASAGSHLGDIRLGAGGDQLVGLFNAEGLSVPVSLAYVGDDLATGLAAPIEACRPRAIVFACTGQAATKDSYSLVVPRAVFLKFPQAGPDAKPYVEEYAMASRYVEAAARAAQSVAATTEPLFGNPPPISRLVPAVATAPDCFPFVVAMRRHRPGLPAWVACNVGPTPALPVGEILQVLASAVTPATVARK